MGISNRYDDARREMIKLLQQRGIADQRVLKAMEEIPRHLFVGEVFRSKAYDDSALPIECQQTISQPYTVAFMTQALEIQAGQKVLEIGTGSGYQACIIACMGARVFTIERHFALLEYARKMFDLLRLNIASKAGDGSVGWSEFAPYDRIIVTAGAPDIPVSLSRQLTDDGVMIIPVGSESNQDMTIVRRKGQALYSEKYHSFKFVPLIGKEGWKR